MRLNKALICAVLICALSLPSFAEEGASAVTSATEAPSTPAPAAEAPASPAPVTESPTQQPMESTPSETTTEEPTKAPSEEPSEEPTAEPSQVPSEAPTEAPSTTPSEAPTAEPSQVPSEAPTEAPSQAPSADPTLEPSEGSTQAPTNEPTLEPSAAPQPQPGEDDGQISIQAEGKVQLIGDSWKFASLDPAAPLCFHWICGEAAASYLIYTSDASGALRFISETGSNRIELSSTDYANGCFTFHVGALLSDGSYTWGSARFELEAQGGFGGGHGGFGGSFGGGRPSGSNSSAMLEEEAGFRVTPGKALTSSHASGTKNSTAYTFSTIPSNSEAMYQLYLESTQSEITLDAGESAFFANRSEGKLTLTPANDGAQWTLSVLAIRTLAQSGIERVVFELGNTRYSLSTCMEFSGASFAALRSQGYVSKDLALMISQRGVVVSIGANEYSIDESGALVPLGADSK